MAVYQPFYHNYQTNHPGLSDHDNRILSILSQSLNTPCEVVCSQQTVYLLYSSHYVNFLELSDHEKQHTSQINSHLANRVQLSNQKSQYINRCIELYKRTVQRCLIRALHQSLYHNHQTNHLDLSDHEKQCVRHYITVIKQTAYNCVTTANSIAAMYWSLNELYRVLSAIYHYSHVTVINESYGAV